MMNSFDLGGCCLARYGAASSYFASKTDQIMSRYRPIAPKPAAQSSTAGACVADGMHSSSSMDSTRIRTGNRTRKRSWDSAPSPRAHKRPARARSSAGAIEAPPSERQVRLERSPMSNAITPCCANRNALRHSDTSEEEEAVSPICETQDSAVSTKNFSTYGRPPFGYPFDASSTTTAVFAQKDAAFMERAAASAAPNVGLPENTRMKSLQSQLQSPKRNIVSAAVQPRFSSDMQSSAVDMTGTNMLKSAGFFCPELALGIEAGTDEKQDLVTLPLLPTAPYRKESPSSSSCVSNLSSVCESSMQTLYDDCQSLPELSLSAKTKPTTPAPLLDISYLEHLYSASPDPVVLTDESRKVIWYNPAYNKRSASETPLGIPTPLATFTLNKSVFKMENTTATLWGFVKKFISPDIESLCTKKGVIMPQAVRPVGSTVSVECMTDTNLQASPLRGTIEEIEHKLETESTMPCLISDANNRVRWANSAYKQMVGQPECSWLQSSPHNNTARAVMRINGEIGLLCNRFELPTSAATTSTFSCRVKIQWTNPGARDKSSLTVPCDVVGINGGPKDYVFAWKFDTEAALCL